MKVNLPLCYTSAGTMFDTSSDIRVYYVPVELWGEDTPEGRLCPDYEFYASGEETDKKFGLNSSEFSLANGGKWDVDLGGKPTFPIKEMFFTNKKNAIRLRTYLARELRKQGYEVEYEDFA